MSRSQSAFSRGLRLSIGALLLLAAIWAITSASHGWSRIWLVQKQPTVKRPEFVVMDSQIANDPAMQATKLKAAGPIAQLIEKSEDSGAIASADSAADAAPQASSSRTSNAPHSRYVPNTQKSVRVCSGTIAIARSKAFSFRVPANVSFPKLTGQFTSLAKDGAPQSIDVLLLDPQQYSDFLHGNGVDSLMANNGSSAQIDFALSPTVDQPRQYYLVMENSSGAAVTVNARFVVSFD